MNGFRRKQLQIVAAIVIIFVFGTLGYYVIEEDWTLLDAFYMVAISITTVGFGEIHSLSPTGRIFTIVLIFLGLGLAATFATHLARLIVENELRGIFGRKKTPSVKVRVSSLSSLASSMAISMRPMNCVEASVEGASGKFSQ